MSYNAPRIPWQIETDSDDEKEKQNIKSFTTTSRPITPKFIKAPLQTKFLDWDIPKNPDDSESLKHNHTEEIKPIIEIPSRFEATVESRLFSDEPEQRLTVEDASKTSDFDPIRLVSEDPNHFIHTPIPKQYPSFVQCVLKRNRDGVRGRFSASYYLQIERPENKGHLLLLVAKSTGKMNRRREYSITTTMETLSGKNGDSGYVGKLRGNNMTGTEYTLYDNGISPNKINNDKFGDTRENLRRELACIVYNTNLFGMKGPRQISIMIPELFYNFQPTKDEATMLEKWHERRFSRMIQLRNRSPIYNANTKTYVLQFTGNRVAQPSVKNFQIALENENHEEEVVMQFGRVDDNTFTCDFRYPLTAFQAFGIALSSFDSRITRE